MNVKEHIFLPPYIYRGFVFFSNFWPMFMETVFKVFVKNVRARMKFNWDLVDPLKPSQSCQEDRGLLQNKFYAAVFYAAAFYANEFLFRCVLSSFIIRQMLFTQMHFTQMRFTQLHFYADVFYAGGTTDRPDHVTLCCQ